MVGNNKWHVRSNGLNFIIMDQNTNVIAECRKGEHATLICSLVNTSEPDRIVVIQDLCKALNTLIKRGYHIEVSDYESATSALVAAEKVVSGKKLAMTPKDTTMDNNTTCAEILMALIDRFERLDKAGNDADRFACWSAAHSMADDAKRALETIADVPTDLRAEIARILKDAFDCGFNANDDHAFWHFDGPALADAALERHWPIKPTKAE